MAFRLNKLASGRTPDMDDSNKMIQANLAEGLLVQYDATTDALIPAATSDPVWGTSVAAPNQTIADGGGVTFPLGGTNVYPVVLRVYGDTLIEAPVSGTVLIANARPGSTLDIDASATGLTTSVNGDFTVEKILQDDGTNALVVAGYFVNTQSGR